MVNTKWVKKEKILEGKAVHKNNAQSKASEFFKKITDEVKNFEREENIQKILGVVLLVIWLRRLRAWILGLIMIVIWILLLIGYFDKKKK